VGGPISIAMGGSLRNGIRLVPVKAFKGVCPGGSVSRIGGMAVRATWILLVEQAPPETPREGKDHGAAFLKLR